MCLVINHSWQQAGQAFIWQQHGSPQRQKVVIALQQLATPAVPLVEHVRATTWHRLPADYWTKRQSWRWLTFHSIRGWAFFGFLKNVTLGKVRGNKSPDFGQFPVTFITLSNCFSEGNAPLTPPLKQSEHMVGLCGFLVCKPLDKDLNGFYWEESQQGGRDLGVTSYKSYKGPHWESNSWPTEPWTPAWQLPLVPQRHSHQLRVSGATINQPLRGGQREEKSKRGKGGGRVEVDEEILMVWGENESIHPQLQNSETHVHHPSVPHSPPLPSAGVQGVVCILSPTGPTEKQFITVWDGRQGLISVPSPNPKWWNPIYILRVPMQNSTVIKFSRMTLRWLSDAASVCLT